MDKTKLYEGKAKILYDNGDGTLTQYFKDSATAFNNEKREDFVDKGRLNNFISEFLMLRLSEIGIATHFIERIDERSQLIRRAEIFPIEVIVRNRAAGSLCKRFGIDEGNILSSSLVEYCYKSDELGDPPMSEQHIIVFGFASMDDLVEIEYMSRRINDYLSGLFRSCGMILVDFKLEYGLCDGEIILADEISPDTCRLWDSDSFEKLDKDRFREDLGGVMDGYRLVSERLGIKF